MLAVKELYLHADVAKLVETRQTQNLLQINDHTVGSTPTVRTILMGVRFPPRAPLFYSEKGVSKLDQKEQDKVVRAFVVRAAKFRLGQLFPQVEDKALDTLASSTHAHMYKGASEQDYADARQRYGVGNPEYTLRLESMEVDIVKAVAAFGASIADPDSETRILWQGNFP